MKQETLSWGERPVCTPWTKFASSQVQQVPAQTGAKPIMYVHPLFSCRSISAYHGRPLVLQRDYLVLLQRFGRFLTCRSPASSYRDSQYCGMMGSAALAKVPRHFRTQGATEYVVSTGLPYGTNRTVLGEDVHSRKAFTVNLDQINPPPHPARWAVVNCGQQMPSTGLQNMHCPPGTRGSIPAGRSGPSLASQTLTHDDFQIYLQVFR